MSTNFEWMRIAFAMALMTTGFILLPAYFLWKDKRDDERQAAAQAAEHAGASSTNGNDR